MRILIADDQKHARQSLKALVAATHPDAEILEAATGIEAVALAGETRPGLVILDVRMPEPRRHRGRARDQVPVARDQDPRPDRRRSPAVRQALAAGADAFVAKWEPPDRVMSVLSSLL